MPSASSAMAGSKETNDVVAGLLERVSSLEERLHVLESAVTGAAPVHPIMSDS